MSVITTVRKQLTGSPPIVVGNSFNVTLPATNGQVVGTVTASNNPTSWTIIAGNSSGYFAINNSGVITVTSAGASGLVGGSNFSLTCSAANSFGTGNGTASVSITGTTTGSFTAQTTDFTIEWDAIPSASGEDTIFGLSFNTPVAPTDIACIVAFTTTGNIQVRNAGAYSSTNTVTYVGGTSYHFRVIVRMFNHTYDVLVAPSGSSEVLLANNFAFRTEQAAVSTLNYLGKLEFTGTVAISGMTSPVFGPIMPQTGDFNIEWNAVPSISAEDTICGLSFNAPATFTDIACIIAFTAAGNIQVRNGGSYGASAVISYTGGTSYHFRLVVRISTHTYDVYVTPFGSGETFLANNFAFRTEQAAVGTLNYLGKLNFTGTVAISNATAPTVANSSTVGLVSSFTTSPGSQFLIDSDLYTVEGAGQSYSMTNPDPYTLRFEVHQGDNWAAGGDSNLERSEIQNDSKTVLQPWGAYIPDHTAIHIDYQFMIESPFTNTQNITNGWFAIGQLHNDDVVVATSPPFTFEMNNLNLKVMLRYVAPGGNPSNSSPDLVVITPYQDSNPIVTDVYHHMHVEIFFSNSGGGYCQVTVDGVQVLNYSGLLGYGETGSYWEYGVYRSTASDIASVRYRNMSITAG